MTFEEFLESTTLAELESLLENSDQMKDLIEAARETLIKRQKRYHDDKLYSLFRDFANQLQEENSEIEYKLSQEVESLTQKFLKERLADYSKALNQESAIASARLAEQARRLKEKLIREKEEYIRMLRNL